VELAVPRAEIRLAAAGVVVVPLAAVAERIGLAGARQAAVVGPGAAPDMRFDAVRLRGGVLKLDALPAVVVVVLVESHPAVLPRLCGCHIASKHLSCET
jgi:hypothetical protein